MTPDPLEALAPRLRSAVRNAVASGAIEGWVARADDIALLSRVADGRLPVADAVRRVGGSKAASRQRVPPMRRRRWTWGDYLYPGTDVLVNRLDIHDPGVLDQVGGMLVAARSVALATGSGGIAQTLDGAHLRALHHWIAQDVYAWAGVHRDVSMRKGSTTFAPVADIAHAVRRAEMVIAHTDWASVDDKSFAVRIAAVFAWLNHAHPFRDLNGRATRLLLDCVSARADRALDYGAVPPAVWLQRSASTAPDRGQSDPQPQWMAPVFSAMSRPLAT